MRDPSYAPRIASTIAPMSGARMNVSPISAARTPAERRALQIAACANAALTDQAHIRRHRRGQFKRVFQPYRERAQIAVVDTDKPGARVQHTRQVRAIVQLNQRLQTQLVRSRNR